MNTFASYRLHITPLSPVHIGTGESYEPTNYVIDDGVLHEFDTGAAMAAFSAEDRKELLAIANRKPDENMIKNLQGFFYDRRDKLKAWAVNAIPVLPGVADLYATRVGQTANREADGKQVLNRLEIDRTGYNPITRKPVLFGSSLKGAVRTALLNQVNGGYRAHERKGLHEFQGRLFRYRDSEDGKLYLERDPMRLFQISDAYWKQEPDLPAAQIHLAVNRKKAAVVDEKGHQRESMAEKKQLYQILECVPSWCYRAFSAQINLQDVNNLGDLRRLPGPNLRYSIQTIAGSCNDFYRDIFAAEIKQLSARGYLCKHWAQNALHVFDVAKNKIQRGEAFLLRVGRHSGAESVTVSGARNGNIKIMEGKDPVTGKQRFSYAGAPKTFWLAANAKDQQSSLLPFGWVLVEIQPLEAPEREWPELRKLCEPHLNAAREFAAKRREQAEAMAKARVEAEAKRREEEEKERRKAEEEARLAQEEAERQARLAAMSPEMQAVEEFRTYYLEQKAKGRYQPGGLFDEKRRAIVTSALQWQDTGARRALATLLRQTVKEWTDWPNKKERKAELRSWLEQLENSED
jgi:CRISPR-associated protein Csm5